MGHGLHFLVAHHGPHGSQLSQDTGQAQTADGRCEPLRHSSVDAADVKLTFSLDGSISVAWVETIQDAHIGFKIKSLAVTPGVAVIDGRLKDTLNEIVAQDV